MVSFSVIPYTLSIEVYQSLNLKKMGLLKMYVNKKWNKCGLVVKQLQEKDIMSLFQDSSVVAVLRTSNMVSEITSLFAASQKQCKYFHVSWFFWWHIKRISIQKRFSLFLVWLPLEGQHLTPLMITFVIIWFHFQSFHTLCPSKYNSL